MAGFPRTTALQLLEKLEPFDRGWYAGPVGYVAHNVAEFTVAIRSGLVFNDTLSVYAGAGLVSGSHPDTEWEEIENKISRFMRIFDQ